MKDLTEVEGGADMSLLTRTNFLQLEDRALFCGTTFFMISERLPPYFLAEADEC